MSPGLIAFFVVVGIVLVGAGFVARATPKNIHPVPIDATWSTIGAFYRDRPERDREVDLGDGWRSVTDPGAAFALSWIMETEELVALRRQAHPDFASGLGIVASMPSGLDKRATGMKVLAVIELGELLDARPERYRSAADGLDAFTAALGAPYQAPRSDQPSA